ncbi:MAG: hypothetical protein C0595_06695 [Marinilabiliales bacterium]|nr:MAG: hypothetical protein C0595_06695 [Marinilabiliales bacterium]
MKENSTAKIIKKRLVNILFYFLMVIISLPIAITILFRSPLVQTLSARLATDWLSNKIDRTVSIEAVNFSFYDGIYISGLELKDQRDSTIIAVDKLNALPKYPWITSINFAEVELDGAYFALTRYKGDDDFGFLTIIKDLQGEKSGNPSSFELKIDNITLKQSRFRLYDENQEYNNGKGMDYGDMDFSGINALLEDFDLINDSLMIDIKMLQAQEKSGFKVNNISARYSISSTAMEVLDSKVSTDDSNLDFDLEFIYSSYADMNDFLDSVIMKANVRNSELLISDLGYYSEVLFDMPDKVKVSGNAIGTVRELNGDNLVVEYGNSTTLNGDFYIKGLPDFYTSYIQMGIQDFSTTLCDIESFILPIDEKHLNLPLNIPCNEKINLSGNFEGYYTDFESNINLSLKDATIATNINFKEKLNDSIFIVSTLDVNNLNVGQIIDQTNILGKTTFKSQLYLKGIYPDKLKLDYDLLVDSINVIGNHLNRMKLVGNFENEKLTSNFRITDKNLVTEGNLTYHFDEVPRLILSTNIKKINIYQLGFWTSPLILSTKLNMDIKSFDLDETNTDIAMHDIRLSFGKDNYEYDSIIITKEHSGNNNLLKLSSDIVEMDLQGDYNITTLTNSTLALLNSYYELLPPSTHDPENNYADLSLKLKNTKMLNKHLFKGLSLDKNTSLKASLDFEDEDIYLDVVSEKANLFGMDLLENHINLTSGNEILNFKYNIDALIMKDSSEFDKTVLGIDSVEFKSSFSNNHLDYRLTWENPNKKRVNRGLISGRMLRDSIFDILEINKTDVVINNIAWTIDTTNSIGIVPGGVKIENLNIYAGGSKLEINGELLGEPSDTLVVNFRKWDISFFDILTRSYGVNLDGMVDGYLNIGTIGTKPTFVSNLNFENLVLNQQYLGRAHILNTWDNHNESIYLKAQIINDEQEIPSQMLLAGGYYYPFKRDSVFDISIDYKDFKLPAVEPFLESYITDLKGLSTGKLKLKGNFEKPELTGYAKINNTSLIIKYLNTRYLFSNLIVFDKDMIQFDKLIIFDTIGNQAKISGFMKHDYFRDSELHVNIITDKLLFFNTTRSMNDLYYGSGILKGNMSVTGKPNDIKLQIETTTLSGTRVYLPLDYSTEVYDKDYIIFVKNEKDSLQLKQEEDKLNYEKEKELKFNIDLGMNITPTARIFISMPSNMGDIESQGSGKLDMNFNSDGDFNLYGEYIVDRGRFKFTIENLVNKRFEIVKGGRISWTGDPYTANIDLKGLYRVKANLNSLGISIDSSTNFKNKVNVECYIKLTNQLLDPTISFEIKIPDLDPDLQRQVFSQLDTTNTAMMNQQMISLLVLGSFSYSNASNYNLSTSGYTILTNQLSSMLSRISDDFDIGVNYKPGDNISNREFEVALSTQLFDDRLLIDGNFGVSYDNSGQSASNIVGDVDVAYKLTEDGRWILKAYNHSNVNSWYYYNNYDKVSPYTQGVGVAFKKEFTTLKQLFKSRKKSTKNKNKNE